jgi:integrase
MSAKTAERAMRRWGWKRDNDTDDWERAQPDAMQPITLHECRHTYASFLMAAGPALGTPVETSPLASRHRAPQDIRDSHAWQQARGMTAWRRSSCCSYVKRLVVVVMVWTGWGRVGAARRGGRGVV